MLLYPSINTLNEKTDSRYSLVILTAKRARDLVDGKLALTEDECERPVSQAAREIADDLISCRRPEPAAEEVIAEEPAAEAEEAAEEAAAEAEETEEPDAGAEETEEAAAEEE